MIRKAEIRIKKIIWCLLKCGLIFLGLTMIRKAEIGIRNYSAPIEMLPYFLRVKDY